jgi:hydrogenase/urease accessory protein HupE
MAGAARLKRAAHVAALLAGALVPGAARAHGATNVGDFYAGLAQPLYHPESLLLLVALGLFAGQAPAERRYAAPVAFAAATLVGAAAALLGLEAPVAIWVLRAGTIALGLLVAARRSTATPVLLALGAVLGLAQGFHAAFGDRADLARPLLYALGLALAPLVTSGWLILLAERARAFWMQVGLRVVGSWVATIALLVSALALAR